MFSVPPRVLPLQLITNSGTCCVLVAVQLGDGVIAAAQSSVGVLDNFL